MTLREKKKDGKTESDSTKKKTIFGIMHTIPNHTLRPFIQQLHNYHPISIRNGSSSSSNINKYFKNKHIYQIQNKSNRGFPFTKNFLPALIPMIIVSFRPKTFNLICSNLLPTSISFSSHRSRTFFLLPPSFFFLAVVYK